MIYAHKIALTPNNKQRTFFAKSAGTARFAYNWGLSRWKELYNEGQTVSEVSLRRELNARKREEFPWMLEVGKCSPQQALKDLGQAYSRFFKKTSGYPKFKKKGDGDSFRVDNGPQIKGADALEVRGRKVRIPRLGWVRMREAIRFKGQIKSGVISLYAGRWFISFSIDVTETPKLPLKNQGSVGVDLGIHHLATLSTGEKISAPRPYRQYMKKLRRLQKSLSRKQKGSQNRKRAQYLIQRCHARITYLRSDALHKLTCSLTNRFHTIGIEDLNVRGMLKNSKLSRAIADMGFYEFRRQLEYKAQQKGGKVVVVNRFFPSSQICSNPSCLEKTKMTLNVRSWTCSYCNSYHDRDINAAMNLENQAVSYTVTACGEGSSGLSHTGEVKLPSVKQEVGAQPIPLG